MIFEHIRPLPRFTQHTGEWVDPIPAVENRAEFVAYTSPVPMENVDIERVPIALAIRVDGVECSACEASSLGADVWDDCEGDHSNG